MRTWLLTAALGCLVSCAMEERAPEDLLERDRFRDLLVEAHLIEARLNHELIVELRSSVPVDRYYAGLFEEEGIPQDRFTRTYRYYLGRPEELKAIYEEVITELTFRKDQPRSTGS